MWSMIIENCPGRLGVTIADGPVRAVQLRAGPPRHVCRDVKSPEVTREEMGVFGGSQKLDKYSPWSLGSRDHCMTVTPTWSSLHLQGKLCVLFIEATVWSKHFLGHVLDCRIRVRVKCSLWPDPGQGLERSSTHSQVPFKGSSHASEMQLTHVGWSLQASPPFIQKHFLPLDSGLL